VSACAPPQHIDPVPTRGTAPPLDAPAPEAAPKISSAIFDPSGVGNWSDKVKLSPAPNDLVAPCLRGHGFAWVRLDTQTKTADVVEASADVPDSARRCIAKALAKAEMPPGDSPLQLLVYITFSPE
jgi:hypothetical protein